MLVQSTIPHFAKTTGKGNTAGVAQASREGLSRFILPGRKIGKRYSSGGMLLIRTIAIFKGNN